ESTREITLLLSARNKAKLAEIEGALEKIRNGTYGICEECDDPIESGRLRVVPLAKFCVSCQANLEKEMVRNRLDEDLGWESDNEAEAEETV
ncbi:MAG TPA: TraR/DksA C4-type zinc finger protein, partial [Thermodesulfobacteriota bacterium]|nr:TraR/DksA C4-type zinc finger protein [Thermodesulfobacteriota bacterium]